MAEKVEFENKEAIRDAIKEVRNEKSEADWVLLAYENAKSSKIVMLGKGSGGVSGFIGQ